MPGCSSPASVPVLRGGRREAQQYPPAGCCGKAANGQPGGRGDSAFAGAAGVLEGSLPLPRGVRAHWRALAVSPAPSPIIYKCHWSWTLGTSGVGTDLQKTSGVHVEKREAEKWRGVAGSGVESPWGGVAVPCSPGRAQRNCRGSTLAGPGLNQGKAAGQYGALVPLEGGRGAVRVEQEESPRQHPSGGRWGRGSGTQSRDGAAEALRGAEPGGSALTWHGRRHHQPDAGGDRVSFPPKIPPEPEEPRHGEGLVGASPSAKRGLSGACHKDPRAAGHPGSCQGRSWAKEVWEETNGLPEFWGIAQPLLWGFGVPPDQ